MEKKSAIILSHWKGHTPKLLSRELGLKVLRPTEDISRAAVILNWGVGSRPDSYLESKVINGFEAVSCSSSKLHSLRQLSSSKVPCPVFSTEKEEARSWLRDGKSIVVRHKLTGKGGEGAEVIKVAEYLDSGADSAEIPLARLYTRYFPKVREVRVHVVGQEIIGYAQKKRAVIGHDEKADFWIRTHNRGWIFATEGIERDNLACSAAVAAIDCLGLDFGAVDVGIDRFDNVCVFEVNTAPGLQGKTLAAYIHAIQGSL